jgi:hypothetical protein
LVLALVLAIGSACTVSQATRMRDMVGTYKLTYYNNRTTNLVERDEMEVYLVVPESGYGYYVYKDKNTPVYIRQMSVSFTPHQEKANRYTHIVYTIDGSSSSVELGRSGDGLNRRVLGGQINDTYWQDTSYLRVSKAQDLSYVSEQLGTLPPHVPYGSARYDGYYRFSHVDAGYNNDQALTDNNYNPFVYAIFDFDFASNKATAYYMLKDNMERVSESYSLSFDGSTTFTVGSKAFVAEVMYSSVYLKIPVTRTTTTGTEVECYYVFSKADRTAFDLENGIQSEIDWYNSMHSQG